MHRHESITNVCLQGKETELKGVTCVTARAQQPLEAQSTDVKQAVVHRGGEIPPWEDGGVKAGREVFCIG